MTALARLKTKAERRRQRRQQPAPVPTPAQRTRHVAKIAPANDETTTPSTADTN